MNRRTKKRDDGWYDINLVIDENVDKELKPLVTGEYIRHSLNKLGHYEDIDEELGIDYPILIKALTNGIYGSMYGGKPDNEINKIIFIEPRKFKLCIHVDQPCLYYEWGWPGPDSTNYRLKDYGKTWALTKEELL